jgi:uncharacterized GH25 family protein
MISAPLHRHRKGKTMLRMAMTTAILIFALIDSAHAHFVWLERDGDGTARAYFGEWIDDIREKTGGLLDRFKAPRLFVGASNEALQVKRNENNLEFAAKGSGDVRFVDSSVPPREDKEKGGSTKTIYYAKHGRSETVAKLDLELIPTTANGNVFVLMFQGAPLAKAEVTIIGPPKWEKPLVTDEQGRVTLPLPWAGSYVLEITYFDEKPGSGKEKFTRTRHISSLYFEQ